MKIILNTTIDLSKDIQPQLENLKLLKQFISENQTVQECDNSTGPMEKMYLSVTGKKRMNHMNKEITREEQAILNLKNLGIKIDDEQKESFEESFTYVLPPEEDDANHDDPLC